MTRPIRLVWLPMVLAVPLASSSGQTVRGVAREQASGTPLSGVLMSLLPYNDSAGVVATALSTDSGTYVLSATQTGRYRLVAKRIVIHRFWSELFEMSD